MPLNPNHPPIHTSSRACDWSMSRAETSGGGWISAGTERTGSQNNG